MIGDLDQHEFNSLTTVYVVNSLSLLINQLHQPAKLTRLQGPQKVWVSMLSVESHL
jgi:hypothetical protein